ncbi:nitroreductase family protein [Paracidovorax cattleyae]|uniref:Nitroreductase n=1 Tax=Paracidovorax cattleyae TaxID=80868 RepID=A0A1H0RNV7_9BURK|nr:nitroreductase family protein [Paracidovorax cattleyae]AVS73981.1 nitroreductase family protein [Paracidovorax cattleyae]MBF9264846.1 nitroreductase family protein [Paracidovorax cattleyae]SDP31079.1 Nitroreductase [Paracidovorax cattleyae]
MSEAVIRTIEEQRTTNLFDPTFRLPDSEIAELVRLATLAPTSFNFQNWRFIAVRTPEAQARLRKISWDQAKITDAAVTFIVTGHAPDFVALADRLTPAVTAGFFPAAMIPGWQGAAKSLYHEQPQRARDEAVRTATFGAMTLIHAAHAKGWGTAPMIGFDAEAVASEFGLREGEIPVLLLSVGRALPENWPRKPRRPIHEVMELV